MRNFGFIFIYQSHYFPKFNLQDGIKILGDQTPALKPWLNDNQNRVLELFNDYFDCKNGSAFFYPYVSLE